MKFGKSSSMVSASFVNHYLDSSSNLLTIQLANVNEIYAR